MLKLEHSLVRLCLGEWTLIFYILLEQKYATHPQVNNTVVETGIQKNALVLNVFRGLDLGFWSRSIFDCEG